MTTQHEKARSIALRLLPADGATRELIEQKVGLVIDMLRVEVPDELVDGDRLVRELESLCNVWMPSPTALDEGDGHEAWLDGHKQEIQWKFWNRYERYLEEQTGMPPAGPRAVSRAFVNLVREMAMPGPIGLACHEHRARPRCNDRSSAAPRLFYARMLTDERAKGHVTWLI